MATITHTCAQCGKRLGVPDRYVGRDLKCPQCGNPFRIEPEALHPPAAPAEGVEPGSVPPTPEPTPAIPTQPPRAVPPPVAPPPVTPPSAEAPSAAPPPAVPPSARGAEEPFPQAAEPQETAFGSTEAMVSWRLRRVGVFSVALISTVVYAIFGLFVGLLVAAVGMLPRAAGVAVSALRGPLLGAAAVVALPFVYAVIGFFSGLLFALLYNLAARLTGGVELTME
jgi:DNA-directed RNA polymerase subunit RPC12/RpoP